MKHHAIALLALCFLVSACAGKKDDNAVESAVIENEASSDTDENDQPESSSEFSYVEIGGYMTDNAVNSRGMISTIFVTIGENYSADFSGIEQLSNADDLWLYMLKDSREVDFSPLRYLQQLESIYLRGRGVTIIPDFSASPSIKKLEISFGNLSSLDGIEKMPFLEYLTIGDNRVHLADMSALRYLTNLKFLNITTGSYNIDFSALKDLPGLTELWLQGIDEVDVLGVAELTSLEKLYLTTDKEYSHLDVSPLSKLSNLRVLYIIGFEMESVEALDALPHLDSFVTKWSTGGE